MTIDFHNGQLVTVEDTVNCTEPFIVGPSRPVQGIGPVGNDKRGPILQFVGDIDGVVFNGRGLPYQQGTGGSIRDVKVVKASGGFGGNAITVTALSPANRGGEITIANCRCFDQGALGSDPVGRWGNGIVVKGDMLTEPGAAGIRRTVIRDCRVSNVIDFSLLLVNAVHVTVENFQCDPGGGVASILVDGGENINFSSLICNGVLNVRNANGVIISGPRLGDVMLTNCTNVIMVGNARNLVVDKVTSGIFVGSVAVQKTIPWFSNFRIL